MKDESIVTSHTVVLRDRRHTELCGIDDVLSFDEGGLSAHSSMGDIYIEGEELKVEGFSSEKGLLTVSGLVWGIYYIGDSEKGRDGKRRRKGR